MSIEALAEAAGLSWRMLIGIEHGKRNPSLLTILAIAKGLSTEPYVLVRSASSRS
jgi:transcriptional regulator with XRE-family HTH domain